MSSTELRERLQALPPELPDAPARYEQVRARVRRRRRRQVAGIAAGAMLVAVVAPIAFLTTSADDDRGTGPAGSPGPTLPIPGADRVTELAEPRVHQGTGTTTVALGDRPANATSVSTELTCLSAGRIRWSDGAATNCSAAEVPSTESSVTPLGRGQQEIVIRAGADVEWRISTTYVRVETTDWGVNANGDTFGASNDRGDPDLTAVIATNGRRGYVYDDQLEHATGGDVKTLEEARQWQAQHGGEEVTLPVYESDGVTVVGDFVVGGGGSAGRERD